MLDLDFAHGIAHRTTTLVASVGDHGLKIRIRERPKGPRVMCEVLVDALHSKRRAEDRWVRARPIYPATAAMLAAGRESD